MEESLSEFRNEVAEEAHRAQGEINLTLEKVMKAIKSLEDEKSARPGDLSNKLIRYGT